MKSVFSVSSVLLALFLTACGGGGSSSTTAITSISNAVVQPKPVQKVDGYSLTAKKDNRQAQPLTGSQGINTVTIDGKTLDFIAQGVSTGHININADNQTRIGSGNALSYMRYGYVADTAKNVSPTLFAQGIATASDKVPTTGKATYNGTAVDNNKVSYNARFDVNYKIKTVGGTLTPQKDTVGAKDILLSAKINGNQFASTGTYDVNGQFYGPNAEELGGVFKNHDDSLSGAFGAKK